MTVKLENFEGLTDKPNSPASFRFGEDGYLQPGFIAPFAFASGLKLLEPFPNDDDDSGETLVGEFATMLNPTWGLADNGKIDAPADLPSGTAFIGANRETDGTLVFGFPGKVYTVTAFVDAVRDQQSRGLITATAYDASGDVITSSRILSVPKGDWDENLIALRSKTPIVKVVFTGNFLVLDDLSFDDTRPDIVNGTKKNDRIGPSAAKNTSNEPEVIRAKGGNDKVFALGGDDTIDGGKGKDKVHAGAGNDTLICGPGKDKLWGGQGQDTFLYKAIGAAVRIKDFNVAEDSIVLDRDAFPLVLTGHLSATAFNDGSTPVDSDSRVIFKAATGKLFFDPDGSGRKKAVLFAKLAPDLDLGAENFFVV